MELHHLLQPKHAKQQQQQRSPGAMQPTRATFAAGCFWGTERYFKKQFGDKISQATVGYQGGAVAAPSYEQVCTGTTNHAEALTFTFDPARVQYRELLAFFFRMHDPTTLNRQQNDRGTQYRSAVFFHTPEQRELADQMIAEFNTAGTELHTKLTRAHGPHARVVTTVEDGNSTPFWPAEAYHQAYLDAHPSGYCSHRIYF